MAQDTIRYMFLLMALLIAAAYFVGVSTDINSLSAGVNQLVKSLTAQGPNGFLAYPTNAPLGGQVQGAAA